jgi:hypothetical protein
MKLEKLPALKVKRAAKPGLYRTIELSRQR